MRRDAQVAALPWRRGKTGIEILLVTTRTTKRWVIPKGWPMDGKADHEAAAIEAFEEAGVHGLATSEVFGRYGYLKLSEAGKARHITVVVFTMRVDRELECWPEQHQRERRWVSPGEAIELTGEAELVPLLMAFANWQPPTEKIPPVESKSAWAWLVDLFR